MHCGSVQAVRPIGGVEVQLYSFLTTALEGGAVGVTPLPFFTPGKTRYPLYRGWVGPRAGLDMCGKSRPPPGFHPRTVQPVASRYTAYATRSTAIKLIDNNIVFWFQSTQQYIILYIFKFFVFYLPALYVSVTRP